MGIRVSSCRFIVVPGKHVRLARQLLAVSLIRRGRPFDVDCVLAWYASSFRLVRARDVIDIANPLRSQEFAYNEASFVLIRLLQVFDKFTVAQAEAAPLDCLPPAEWKFQEGRKATEEFWPGQGITTFAKVKFVYIMLRY